MRLPSTFPSARASRVVLASACLLVAGAAHGGVAARQHLAVTESDYRLDAPGLQGLHAGLVTVSVRNTAAGQHGSWEGMLELSAGRYVILSGGSNGGKTDYRRGMIHAFSVATGGARGTPPDAVGRIAMVHELLAGLDPGHTAWVRFNLARGHYVALCLVAKPKLHADLGMVGEFMSPSARARSRHRTAQ